jgi:hypothetical protein
MPRRAALPDSTPSTEPLRPAQDMSVLLRAAVRQVARHSWFHDPESPFVQVSGPGRRLHSLTLGPGRGRVGGSERARGRSAEQGPPATGAVWDGCGLPARAGDRDVPLGVADGRADSDVPHGAAVAQRTTMVRALASVAASRSPARTPSWISSAPGRRKMQSVRGAGPWSTGRRGMPRRWRVCPGPEYPFGRCADDALTEHLRIHIRAILADQKRSELPGLIAVRNRSGRPGSRACVRTNRSAQDHLDDLGPSRVVTGVDVPDSGQGRAPGSTCARQPGSSAVQV